MTPGLGGQVCWVKSPGGCSRPWLVHSATPWWVYPERAVAGQLVRVFGRNLDAKLVSLRPRPSGPAVFMTSVKGGRNPLYEASFTLPADLKSGEYDLYVHSGSGGEAGWGGPLPVHVQAPASVARQRIDARQAGARGNGYDDDTHALQQALNRLSGKGGVLYLPPGRYPVSATLQVPPGVSLIGSGAANSILEVPENRALQGDFPEAAQLEHFARDWLPHMKGFGYPPMVWLRQASTLSDLALWGASGAGMGVLVARCPGVAEDIHIERCRMHLTGAQRNWVNDVCIRVAGDTYGLVVRDCDLVGHGGFEVISTSNRQAYFGGNNVQCVPVGSQNNVFLRGFVDSLIENNVVRDGDRNFACQLGVTLGKHEIPEGKSAPSPSFYHTALLGNMFYNSLPRRHNEGETMYEAGDAFWRGRPLRVTADSLTVADSPFWTDLTGAYVLVLDGPGFGQYRRVVKSTVDTLTVSPAWDVPPDTTSYLMVNGFFAETLWIDNTEEHTANWTGWWGNAVGNVMDGHILRDGEGIYLWGWSQDTPSPVAFNDLIGCHVINRGNLMMLGTLVFGNTVRFTEVVGYDYRPSFHIQPTWVFPGYDPEQRAGLDLTAGPHKMDGMPETAPWKAWNVVEGSQFYDGPAGIHIGPETQHLILRHNAIFPHGERLRDESGGRGFLAPPD